MRKIEYHPYQNDIFDIVCEGPNLRASTKLKNTSFEPLNFLNPVLTLSILKTISNLLKLDQ